MSLEYDAIFDEPYATTIGELLLFLDKRDYFANQD